MVAQLLQRGGRDLVGAPRDSGRGAHGGEGEHRRQHDGNQEQHDHDDHRRRDHEEAERPGTVHALRSGRTRYRAGRG